MKLTGLVLFLLFAAQVVGAPYVKGDNFLWKIDGAGNIGADGATRPDNIFLKTKLKISQGVGASVTGLEMVQNTTAGGPNVYINQLNTSAASVATDLAYNGAIATNYGVINNAGTHHAFFDYGNGSSAFTTIQEAGTKNVIIGGATDTTNARLQVVGKIELRGASGANLIWNTDGGGNIGASGATRPDNAFIKTKLVVGPTGINEFGTVATSFIKTGVAGAGHEAVQDNVLENSAAAKSGIGQVMGISSLVKRSGSVTDTNTGGYSAFRGALSQVSGTYVNATTAGFATFRVFPYAVSGTSTVSHYAGFRVDDDASVSGTNKYGLYIGNITGATNNYAIFTGTGLVNFGDTVTLSSTLAVTGTSAFTGISTFTGGTASTSTTTGQAVITGGLGVSGATWIGGLANIAGNVTLGSGSGYTLTINKSGGEPVIKLSNGTASQDIHMSALAGVFRITDNTALVSLLSSTQAGLWTLGASGGTQTHAVNGSLAINNSAGPHLQLTDGGTFGSNANPHMEFRDGTQTGVVLGYNNAAASIFRFRSPVDHAMFFNQTTLGDMGGVTTTGEFVWGQTSSGNSKMTVNSASSSTTDAGNYVLMLRNGNSTVNNVETLAFGNNVASPSAGISAVNETHSNPATGSLHFWTQNSGQNAYGITLDKNNKTSFAGATAYKNATFTSIANANTGTTIFPSAKGYYRITGSTAMGIQGITAGIDGQVLRIYSNSGANTTFAHQSGTESVAANRIVTMTGADVATTTDGFAELIYDTTASRWILMYVTP